MKILSVFVISVALILGLAGCFAAPTQHNLTVSATEGGEVTTPDGQTSGYGEGTEAPLVAFPYTGYRFVNWSGDVDAVADINAASTTVTMNGDYAIRANFVAVCELTISSTEGGSVDTPPGEGSFMYDTGTRVTLAAIPDDGYLFVEWTGDVNIIADAEDAITTMTVNGDYSITANFAEDEVVTFPDPSLEAAVRQAVAKPEGPIYSGDVGRLGIFYAEGRGISSLTGLEHATGLTNVWLGDNQISDVSPLAGLTELRDLRLQNNRVSDISPLANVTSLAHLNLGGNRISDVSPLGGLNSLIVVRLHNNRISDISALANLTSLWTLELWDNQISDISPLADLTRLMELWLEGNQVSDTSPLVDNEGLSQGDRVYLNGNPLSADSINMYIPQLEARGVIVEY